VIALIDYRAGNLTSVRKAFAAIGAELYDPQSSADLGRAAAIVVPGVGHFGATSALDSSWTTAIRAHVTAGRPLLGICLGLQWLFAGSEEAPESPGLGVLSGTCYRLSGQSASGASGASGANGTAGAIKVPHVGWNSLAITREASIVDGVTSGSQVYFTHSFVAPVTPDTVAVTEHGEPFAAIVQRGRIAGVQFHPEKSGEVGLQILRNFVGSAS
jgi:imidazole glycerol-phosphate synthase subunit HisH